MSEPTMTGVAGRAWLIPNKSGVPDHQAGIASWIVNVPGAHPYWSYWMVACCHLRDLPGVPPAKKKYPEAEYEFLIASIDPEKCPAPTVELALQNGLSFLLPMDVVEQFHGVTDKDVSRICELAVRTICDGRLSPDQDYRSAWHQIIQTTVRHFREGQHLLH